jgi:acyl-CoA-binding protein
MESFTYVPATFEVLVIEANGEVRVTDLSGKPLNKCYIKVFYKDHSGNNHFYKDGYTDLRGTFNYQQLNLGISRDIEKFALLVSATELGLGVMIREAAPYHSKAVGADPFKKKYISDAWVKGAAGDVKGKHKYENMKQAYAKKVAAFKKGPMGKAC